MARAALITFYDDSAIGIRTIGAYLKELGHECLLVFIKYSTFKETESPVIDSALIQYVQNGTLVSFDYAASPLTVAEKKEAIDALVNFSPDVIGVSTRSFFDNLAQGVLLEIKEALPEVVYAAGGFGPTLGYEKWADFVDIVVRGDGEEAMADILRLIDEGKELKGVPNTVCKEDGQLVLSPMRPPVKDISKYPQLFDLNEHSIYVDQTPPDQSISKDYSILMGRGCVGTCSYCSSGNWKTLYKNDGLVMPPRRVRDEDDIISELHKAKERGFTRVVILDDFLVAPIDTMFSLFKKYRDQIGLPFQAFPHPRVMLSHPELLDLLVEAGLDMTVIGIQTGDEAFSMDVYNRKQRNADIIRFAKLMSAANVRIYYHFIHGNPLENEQSLQTNYELIKDLPFDSAKDAIRVYAFTPWKMSPIVNRFGMEKLTGYDMKKWHVDAMRMGARAIATDEEFSRMQSLQTPQDVSEAILDICADRIYKGEDNRFCRDEAGIQKKIFESLKGQSVYIWGYGGRYHELQNTLEDVNVLAIFDNNQKVQGQSSKDGVPIYSPEKLRSLPKHPIVVASVYYREIRQQVHALDPSLVVIRTF